MRDHALREQTLERLVDRRMPGLVHGAGEEARIEEMQDRVLDAADILVDREPVADGIRIDRHLRMRRAEAREVPGRIDEGVHGVGLARGRPAAARAGHVLPGGMAIERIAAAVEAHILRELHRQILLRHRHDAAFLAMDHRDRATPIALPRDAPVAQAELGAALALRRAVDRFLGEVVGDLLLRRLDGEAVEKARVDQRAVAGIGLIANREALGIGARRQHHRDHGKADSASQIRDRADRAPGSRRWRRCRIP